jgi:hypothetical protein
MFKYTDPLRTFNDCGQIRRIIVFPRLYLITGYVAYHRMWLITWFLTCATLRFALVKLTISLSRPRKFIPRFLWSSCSICIILYSVLCIIVCLFTVHLSCVYHTVFSGLMAIVLLLQLLWYYICLPIGIYKLLLYLQRNSSNKRLPFWLCNKI